MNDGGILILSEKIIFEDKELGMELGMMIINARNP